MKKKKFSWRDRPRGKNDDLFYALRAMPLLSHWPDRSQPFDLEKSEVVLHILGLGYGPIKRAASLFHQAQRKGCIVFDAKTKLWQGSEDWTSDDNPPPEQRGSIEVAPEPFLARIMPGIYFLYQGKTLVYVGESDNIWTRICDHVRSGLNFTAWSYREVSEVNMRRQEERDVIQKLRPVYNARYNGDTWEERKAQIETL